MTVSARSVIGMWIRRKRRLEGGLLVGEDNECARDLLSWGGVCLRKWGYLGAVRDAGKEKGLAEVYDLGGLNYSEAQREPRLKANVIKHKIKRRAGSLGPKFGTP